jgi:hypothetical protein
MTRRARHIGSLLVCLLVSSLACQAQLFRAYLASSGNDANPCTVAQPCRLLPAALNAVADGGEIWILDSANYNQGTVIVTKSVSILVVPGQIGSIVAAAGAPAMTIPSSVSVGLRNLVIAGNVNNPGTHGVVVSGGSASTRVSVEDSLFVNLPGNGIVFQNVPVRGYVKNSVFRNNGDQAVVAANGPVVEVTQSRMFGNANGAVHAAGTNAGTTTVVDVSDCTISGGSVGVMASTTFDAVANVMVTRSTIQDTGAGLNATASADLGHPMVVVTNSTVSNNVSGFVQSGTGSVVKSLGNNYIADNGGDSGTLSTALLR